MLLKFVMEGGKDQGMTGLSSLSSRALGAHYMYEGVGTWAVSQLGTPEVTPHPVRCWVLRFQVSM